MSYKTLEVELENGRVRPSGSETLPAKAHALLTILTPVAPVEPFTASGSLADCVAEFAGIGTGKHDDLSTNRSHLADFGR
jgi:hypothetical protein